MSVIHDSTRTSLGLSTTAPSAVTTYNASITQSGFTVSVPVVDGTNSADTLAGGITGYVFGFGGNDLLSNSGSAAVLVGGTGGDTFKMYNNSSAAALADGSILDFEVGSDIIDLSQYSGVSGFSALTISLNTSGATGSFAQITNTAASLNISVASTGGLQNLAASSFIFSGGTTTPTVTSGSSAILGSTGSDTLTGTSGNDSIYGGGAIGVSGDLADSIAGGLGADYLLGNGGADTIFGGSGSGDTADTSSDTIYGGLGLDVIYGNAGDDSLFGGGGVAHPVDDADTIYGGLGNDYILSNGGNDLIYGNAGNDTMHGGLGDDIYAFSSGDGVDTILHFTGAGSAGGDSIHIASGINGSGITSAALAVAAVTYSGGNALLNLGSGNTVTINGITANSLTADDFVIF